MTTTPTDLHDGPADPRRFDAFVAAVASVLDETADEAEILARARPLLAGLVAADDWLPDAYAEPNQGRYRQYLLYRDPADRFSVVSFVWAPGQATPVHDHTVWGLVGVLRGAEFSQAYKMSGGAPEPVGPVQRLNPGDVAALSPRIGDIHQVANALPDAVSVSVHLYGGDIGAIRRSSFDAGGAVTVFVSRYAERPPLRASGAAA